METNDIFHVALANPVFSAKYRLANTTGRIASADRANVGLCDFDHMMIFSGVSALMSSFLDFVLHVSIGIRVKKVIRACARWVVAVMCDNSRGQAETYKKSIAVRPERPSLASELSVSVAIPSCLPLPAVAFWPLSWQLINLTPEPPHNLMAYVWWQARRGAGVATETTSDFPFGLLARVAGWIHLPILTGDIGFLKGKSIG